MKRSLLFVLLFLLWATVLRAEVATPHPVTMRQPDGSTITLRLNGDEFCSWYTSLDGRRMYRQTADGWWKPVSGSGPSRAMRSAAASRRQERDAMMARRKEPLGFGQRHFLVILVEWSDQKFQDGAADYFTRALNEEGFADGGSVGSARDYYLDASYGQFEPQFDVLGPVTLERKHNEWPEGGDPEDDDHHYYMARAMVREAIAMMDDEVDFSRYDIDGDGYMDSVYMFYPGYAQSNGGGSDTIWPHAWGVYSSERYDGVRIGAYACSSELQGGSGKELQGIGTFCHEFGHVLGLPDLYDTDYEENGLAFHPASWNLMAGGNHNSHGCIPARLSTYERYLLGYITEVKELTVSPDIQISDLSNPVLQYIPTMNEGEFFLPEVRDGARWDKSLPAGMIIYHIDRSQNLVAGVTAAKRWEHGSGINVFGEHPCAYIVIPDPSIRPYSRYAMDDATYKNNFYDLWVFPKNRGYDVSYDVKDYDLIAWDGSNPFCLKDIAYSNGIAAFQLSKGSRSFTGTVLDAQTGAALKNAVVLVSQAGASGSSRKRALSLGAARSQASYETLTDGQGRFKIPLEEDFPMQMLLSVFATGYHPFHSEEEGWSVSKTVQAEPVLQGGVEAGLTKARFPLTYFKRFGVKNAEDYSVALHLTAQELKQYEGGLIKSISFSINATGEEVWVFVDYGTRERVLARRINSVSTSVYANYPANKVDISSAGIVVPEGEDLYVGYMIRKANSQYPITADSDEPQEGGLCLYSGFSTTTPPEAGKWADVNFDWDWGMGNALISISVEEPYHLADGTSLKDLGISYIDLPSRDLKSGETLPLTLVTSPSEKPKEVKWFFDGYPVEGESITLSAGTHVITVRLQYNDGKKDQLETQIVVR